MSDSYDASLSKTKALLERSAPSRKRKRGELISDSRDQKFAYITISSLSDPSSITKLVPVCTLLRAQLPLSYLDTSRDPSRLFQSHDEYLASQLGRCEANVAPGIFIAEDLVGEVLCAIENVRPGIYALCRLGSWVKRHHLENAASQSLSAAHNSRQFQPLEPGQPWWQNAGVTRKEQPGTPSNKPRKAPRLCFGATAPGGAATVAEPNEACKQVTQDVVQDNTPQTAKEDANPEADTSSTPEELTQALIMQYLQMLYTSRTSLAYFTKGPLSRARAAFSRMDGLENADLALTLRDMIISSTLSDKKHKTVFLEAIQDMPLAVASDEEHAQKTGEKKQKKKKIKTKTDKKGLLPAELQYFGRWWRDSDDLGLSGETVDQIFKRRSTHLRTREAFLQCILILEVMALESSREVPQSVPPAGNLKASDMLEPVAKPKSKKPVDLHLALELLLDKLSIWHSLDHVVASDSSSKPGKLGKEISNPLRDFCVEVVIPFYIPRIPERAAMINKKLGGPSAPSPAKPKDTAQRPGQPEPKEKQEKKPRKPMQRVTSEMAGSSSRNIPSLSRSATDSLLVPHLKRETSEIPLEQIPRKTSQPPVTKRVSALDKMLLKGREVDFDAMSQAQEARKRKQAEVEEKLREAIGALKKPNRSVASKEMSDVAHQRQLIAQARARTSQSQSQRQSASTNVQITATPKHSRVKNVTVAATPHDRQHRQLFHHPASSSAGSAIPSSTMKPLASSAHYPPLDTAEDQVPQTGHRPRTRLVQITPPRDTDKFSGPSLPAVRPFSLAGSAASTLIGKKNVFRTPDKPASAARLETPNQRIRTLDFVGVTPIQKVSEDKGKARAYEGDDTEDKGKGKEIEQGNDWDENTNIYAALGWDD